MLTLITLLTFVTLASPTTPAYDMSCMSTQEAIITNERYINKYSIWGRPKGLLYGNLVGAGDEQKANLYPDLSCTYNVFNVIFPRGTSITLKGQFPHARYVSFTVANQLGEGQLGNGIFLRGDMIVPDQGSSNPFIPSVGRNTVNRNFTIHILQGNSTNNPPDNTLYTGVKHGQRVHVSIRTYLADEGYDGTGNVKLYGSSDGLPEVILNIPDNSSVTGPALVEILQAIKTGDPNGYTINQWLFNVNNSDDKVNSPCMRVPFAQVFWSTDYSVTGAFIAKDPERRVRMYPPTSSGGFANNPDTYYMIMPFSFEFGEVLIVRGRMPSHPSTRRGDDKLLSDTQVQYFSVSTAAGPASGEGWDTVCDEQIPLDKYGNYTIVVSWPWNRPSNTRVGDDAIWLSPGDGEGHYTGARNWIGVIYIRYQNVNTDWKESPANIPIPTKSNPIPMDPIIMGPYYPVGEYISKDNFEGLR